MRPKPHSLKKILPILTLLAFACTPSGQDDIPPAFISTFDEHLDMGAEGVPGTIKITRMLLTMDSVPWAEGEEVLFLYKGDAESVEWRGDFNRWGQAFSAKGRQIRGTDKWYYRTSFPEDARVDYQIVLNDSEWKRDPANPYTQRGGGEIKNSVLKMPEWEESEFTKEPNQPGETSEPILIFSSDLNHGVNYTIHKTPGFDDAEIRCILYATDGQEYGHPEIGALTHTADNLAEAGYIHPIKLVLVDPRYPETSDNRRLQYFLNHDPYLNFFTGDLIRVVEENSGSSETHRILLGTSAGGVFAANAGYHHPELFPHLIIQSPAVWLMPELVKMWQSVSSQATKRNIFISYGTFFDDQENAAKLAEAIKSVNENTSVITVNEGHSWGNWRNHLDQALVHVCGGAALQY